MESAGTRPVVTASNETDPKVKDPPAEPAQRATKKIETDQSATCIPEQIAADQEQSDNKYFGGVCSVTKSDDAKGDEDLRYRGHDPVIHEDSRSTETEDPERYHPDYESVHSDEHFSDESFAGDFFQEEPDTKEAACDTDKSESILNQPPDQDHAGSGSTDRQKDSNHNNTNDLNNSGPASPKDPSVKALSQPSDHDWQDSNERDVADKNLFPIYYADPDQIHNNRLKKHFGLKTSTHYDSEVALYRRHVRLKVHLVDGENCIISEDQDGRPIDAQLVLDLNDYQPHFEIRVYREPKSARNAGADSLELADPTAEGFKEIICAKYGFKTQDQRLWSHEERILREDDGLGVQVVNVKELVVADRQSHAFFQSLPPATAATMERMAACEAKNAFFCVIVHREEGMLDTRVFGEVPNWAQQIAPVLTNRETCFIVEGSDEAGEAIETFNKYLQEKQYPYKAFRRREKKDEMRIIENAMLSPGAVKLKPRDYSFYPLYQFQDMFEYGTLAYVTASETSRILEAAASALSIGIHELSLMHMPGIQDNSTYLGYLRFERPRQEGVSTYAPRVGDKIDISFDLNESWSTKQATGACGIWQAKICKQTSANTPSGWYACFVKRHWDGKTATFHSFEPRITGTPGTNDKKFNAAVPKVTGQKIRARVIFDDKVLANVKRSVDKLIHASEGQPFTAFNKRMNKVLLGTRLDLLDVVNFFQGPSEELGSDLLQYMKLDKDQTIAFTMATRSRGGISLFQGFPGTGKSHVSKQFTIPFLLCRKSPQQVLIASLTNSIADEIAVALQAMVTVLGKDYPHVGQKYIIREYSQTSDRQYRAVQAAKARIANTGIDSINTARPSVLKSNIEDSREQLPDLTRGMVALIEEGLQYPTEGVTDTRFTHPELSTGGRMLESVGLNPDLAEWPGFRKRHSKFVKYYQVWRRGGFLTKMQMKDFGEKGDELRRDILRHAFAIVGTTAGIASYNLIQAVEPVTTAIILENNPQEAEQNIIPIMAARFQKDPKILLIGDHLHSALRAPVAVTQLVLAKQAEVSFMSRMRAVGHSCHSLTTNYRMAPDISEPTNRIIYDGKLVDHESVSGKFRPLQKAFARWINVKFNRGYANAFFINIVSDDKSKKTVHGSTKSRNDQFHVNVVLTLVVELLEMLTSVAERPGARDAGSAEPNTTKREERVAVLTMYEDQKNMYAEAVSRMRRNKATNIDRLDILSIDEARGKEYAFQVNDLALSEDPGFVSDPRTLNISQTRAKFGLINVGNAEQIENTKGVRALKDFKNHYVKKGKMFKAKSNEWVTTPYLNVGIIPAYASCWPNISFELTAAAPDLGLPVLLSAVKKHLRPGSTMYHQPHRLLLQQLSLTDPKPVNNATGFSKVVAPGTGDQY